MIYLQILLLIVLPIVQTHTWFPDPQRAVRVQTRWNNYKALPVRRSSTVTAVCGALSSTTCWTSIGRPSDEESERCDKYCCHTGHLTGFCQGKFHFDSFDDDSEYKPSLQSNASCQCTNNLIDAKCGPDSSFAGIRCPDLSACQRKCCHEGREGGRCTGFLRLKCRCD